MGLESMLIYVVVAGTALAFGIFVFLVFPRRKPSVEAAVELHPSLGVVQQRSVGTSIASAAPRGSSSRAKSP